MANTRSHSIGPSMSSQEKIAGFCYLPVYLILLSLAIRFLAGLFGLSLSNLQFNLCWFSLNAVFIWAIFHNFLIKSFRAIRFWELIQALILGFALYYAGARILSWLLQLLKLNLVNYNDQAVRKLAESNRWVAMACTIVIAPVVEETLMRGLIFGTIRRKNRILAYVVSVPAFSLLHVYQYTSRGLWPVLLSALLYIPASIALAWTYEKSNTIWAPIFLHMIINLIGMNLI